MIAAYTPNGREIRQVGDRYEVQPANDNYWIDCASVAEAMYRFYFPEGDPSARQIAEVIVASWESQASIDATARLGVSEPDAEAAVEFAGDEATAAAVIAEIEIICRERATV